MSSPAIRDVPRYCIPRQGTIGSKVLLVFVHKECALSLIERLNFANTNLCRRVLGSKSTVSNV